MGGVFFVTAKTNNPTVYLIGIFLFLALGIVMAILGFTGIAGGIGLGVVGVAFVLATIVLLIEYFATK